MSIPRWYRVKDAYVAVLIAPVNTHVTWLEIPVMWKGEFVTWTVD